MDLGIVFLGLLCILIVAVIILLQKLGLIYQLFHKVDPSSTKHGGELVASVLKAHGVKFMFTLCGGHVSPILVASEKVGIKVVDTRHEVNAVFAADAVARLSGTVGVAVVTAGPGLTNTVTAVKNAQMAESPLLLLGGATASILKGRGALQDIDQITLFKPLCKFAATVKYVRDVVPTLRKALSISQSGTPGPVFVELPLDTLYPYHMVEKEVGSKGQPPKSFSQKVVAWYLKNYLNNLFAGAWEKRDTSPLPVDRPMPTPSQVQEATELLSRARKPLILLGSQSTLPPTPVNDLKQALEKLGVPCFLGGMARGMLGKNSPIHIRQQRRDALKEADVVILLGMVCDFRLSYGRVFSRKSKIISVNRNKDQLYKNAGMFWNPTQAVQADPASFLVSLQKRLSGYKCDPEWISTLKQRDSVKEENNLKMAEKPTDVHLNPLKILHCLDDLLPEDSILVADGGDFVGSAAYIVRPTGPLRWLDPGAFGTLGVGGGFALGAKLCRPESEVWIIYGDGSLGYSVAEFDTFTRHKIPVLALVGTDAAWMQICRDQVPMLGSAVGCLLAYTDYHKVAEGYGGKGYLLNRENEDKMKELFLEAQAECKAGKAVLINALIGRTSFREGSISI